MGIMLDSRLFRRKHGHREPLGKSPDSVILVRKSVKGLAVWGVQNLSSRKNTHDMRPYIIVHMMASVDGRIDCDMTEQIDPSDSYYDALDKLACPTQLMGRVTMQMHYADSEPFMAEDKTPIGHEAFHMAVRAEGYTIAMDSMGKLKWSDTEYDGRPLLVITSESCPKAYLDCLSLRNISWIAAGSGQRADLVKAMDILSRDFGVGRLAVTGGGHINGAFLEAGLIDEVSVMIGAGIDGRSGMSAVFDGIDDPGRPATILNLKSVDRVTENTVWLRYTLA